MIRVWHACLTRDTTPGTPATSLCGKSRRVRVSKRRFGIACGRCLRALLSDANKRRATYTVVTTTTTTSHAA